MMGWYERWAAWEEEKTVAVAGAEIIYYGGWHR
jgi:hypothetical protein